VTQQSTSTTGGSTSATQTALFGLIKAHDDISIRFHFVADTSMDIGEAVTTPAVTPIETVVQGTGNIQ